MTNEEKQHKKYFVEEGEPGFSPERNSFVVEQTIIKNDLLRQQKMKDYEDDLGERSEAISYYLNSRAADSGRGIESYLSNKEIAYLRGQTFMESMIEHLYKKAQENAKKTT